MIEGLIISPTGHGVRSDAAGDGHYHAKRGERLHQGVDYICTPGQTIICPINSARVERMAYPYADKSYGGVLLSNNRMELLLFYFEPDEQIFGRTLFKGNAIGIAQDITKRYSDSKMTPHIHLQIDSVDPLLFMNLNQ